MTIIKRAPKRSTSSLSMRPAETKISYIRIGDLVSLLCLLLAMCYSTTVVRGFQSPGSKSGLARVARPLSTAAAARKYHRAISARSSVVSAREIINKEASPSTTRLPLSKNPNDPEQQQQQQGRVEYSRELYLREEAESPFRKVRFFLYVALGAGALTSLFISASRIAAGLAGINADLLQPSLVNAAVDLAGLVVLTVLYRRDVEAQESRLKRASKGAELAGLQVRASRSMLLSEYDGSDGDSTTKPSFTTSLASFRRARGIEKRVVIAAAGSEKIGEVLEQASTLSAALVANDLVIVPVVLPAVVAPRVEDSVLDAVSDCVAMPVSVGGTTGSNWRSVVSDEAREAAGQGVDVDTEGFCVILKKNGRVGQRTKGIYLDNMVGQVTDRRNLGMDVQNI